MILHDNISKIPFDQRGWKRLKMDEDNVNRLETVEDGLKWLKTVQNSWKQLKILERMSSSFCMDIADTRLNRPWGRYSEYYYIAGSCLETFILCNNVMVLVAKRSIAFKLFAPKIWIFYISWIKKTFIIVSESLKLLPQVNIGLSYIEKYFFSKKMLLLMGNKCWLYLPVVITR